jgi:hypothetical protein
MMDSSGFWPSMLVLSVSPPIPHSMMGEVGFSFVDVTEGDISLDFERGKIVGEDGFLLNRENTGEIGIRDCFAVDFDEFIGRMGVRLGEKGDFGIRPPGRSRKGNGPSTLLPLLPGKMDERHLEFEARPQRKKRSHSVLS